MQTGLNKSKTKAIIKKGGGSRIIAAGKTLGIKNIVLPETNKIFSRPDTPLAETPKPKQII